MKDTFAVAVLALLLTVSKSNAQGQMPPVDELKVQAANGDARAQAILGQYYYGGFGVPKDDDQARELFTKSAAANNPLGFFWLGRITEWGACGISKDSEEAQVLYKKAISAGADKLAEGGDIFALDLYGDAVCYGDGGTTKDPNAGMAMREKAATLGNLMAAENIAYRYYYGGTIITPDKAKALKWASVAAKAGLLKASSLAQFLSWDEAAAETKADEQKSNTLVFKGLYLGMPIEDARQTLSHRLKDATSLTVTTENGSKSITLLKMMGVPTSRLIEIIADDGGAVVSIYLSKEVLDTLFDSKDMPQDEFLKTFINAYDIPELEHDTRKIKAGYLGETATTTVGLQQVYTYRSPQGFEVTFFGEPRLDNYAIDGRMVDMAACGDDGSMLLKKIATEKARGSKFD